MEERGTLKQQIIKEMEEVRYIVGSLPEEAQIRKVNLYGDMEFSSIILREGIGAAARAMGKTVVQERVPENWGMQLPALLSFQAGRVKVYQLEERRGE